jgi:flagellar biosynthesis GTPase FlhF
MPAQPTAGARPKAVATAIEVQLAEAGIRAELAREIVAETVSHGLPFASPRRLRKLVREALARRLPVAPTPPAGGRSLAFAGPGGSGKTLCTARLAAAYARGSDLPVVCIALRPSDGGAELRALLEPLGIGVTVADSGEQARAHVAGALSHALVVVDTPAVSPGDAAEVGRLGADLATLGLDEVHLALPSTYSSAVAAELAERLAPLQLTHVALTHMDETTRVGALVDHVIAAGRPLSYVSQGTELPGGIEPADPLDIASLVLP